MDDKILKYIMYLVGGVWFDQAHHFLRPKVQENLVAVVKINSYI